MKCLSMEIMTQNIKKILLLIIFVFISCNKNDQPKADIKISTEKINKDSLNEKSFYKLWNYSSNNLKENYKNFKVYTSSDSIKVYKFDILICSGEIVREKTTFAEFYKNKNTGNDIKNQLKKEFGITPAENIEVIKNSYGDISKKGCHFPFQELFIVNNDYLFYYDKGYYCFDANTVRSKVNEKQTTQSLVKTITKNDFENTNSQFPIINKIISINGTDATSVYKLANNIYLIWFDGDSERWYIVTMIDSKIIDKLLVGKSETIETKDGTIDNFIDFKIEKDFEIILEYSEGKGVDSQKIEKKENFKINLDNLKIKLL